ncbi:MAG: AAA family ATPase, partial [Gemmatimonadota bacterium]
LRNRWRRQRTPDEIRAEIAPNNIILIGPTGVGKTEIARRLAKLAGAPFVKVEASKFTEVGYVGRDVEGMVRDLVENAIDLVRSERETEVADLAHDKVDERLLDLLLPAPPAPATPPASDDPQRVFIAAPDGQVAEEQARAQERHQRTRDKLRQLLRDGQLEHREVEVEVAQAGPAIDALSQQGAPEGMQNFAEMLSEFLPKRTKKRTVPVSEARRILLDEEFDKLINLDDVTADAIARDVRTAGVPLPARDLVDLVEEDDPHRFGPLDGVGRHVVEV